MLKHNLNAVDNANNFLQTATDYPDDFRTSDHPSTNSAPLVGWQMYTYG